MILRNAGNCFSCSYTLLLLCQLTFFEQAEKFRHSENVVHIILGFPSRHAISHECICLLGGWESIRTGLDVAVK
jgi:hypothetical protein